MDFKFNYVRLPKLTRMSVFPTSSWLFSFPTYFRTSLSMKQKWFEMDIDIAAASFLSRECSLTCSSLVPRPEITTTQTELVRLSPSPLPALKLEKE